MTRIDNRPLANITPNEVKEFIASGIIVGDTPLPYHCPTAIPDLRVWRHSSRARNYFDDPFFNEGEHSKFKSIGPQSAIPREQVPIRTRIFGASVSAKRRGRRFESLQKREFARTNKERTSSRSFSIARILCQSAS